MAALTLDHLSGGRFVLRLGVSGPQVVEGWYGQPFPKPLARTREYVDIVSQVLDREAPVTNAGPHYPLPYPGGTGLGKPLKPITHPLRSEIPIVLGAEGPKNVALAAEIADGWFPIFFSPNAVKAFEPSLAEGFARPTARNTADTFEVIAFAPTVIDDDLERAADAYRPRSCPLHRRHGSKGDELPLRCVRPGWAEGRAGRGSNRSRRAQTGRDSPFWGRALHLRVRFTGRCQRQDGVARAAGDQRVQGRGCVDDKLVKGACHYIDTDDKRCEVNHHELLMMFCGTPPTIPADAQYLGLVLVLPGDRSRYNIVAYWKLTGDAAAPAATP